LTTMKGSSHHGTLAAMAAVCEWSDRPAPREVHSFPPDEAFGGRAAVGTGVGPLGLARPLTPPSP
jgi:hypothetical protein